MLLKEILKDWIPPILLKIRRRFFQRKQEINFNKFRGNYKLFTDVNDESPWKSSGWIQLSESKLLQAKKNFNSNLIIPIVPSGYALLALLFNFIDTKIIKVLDFGGGTGFLFWYLRNLFKKDIFWYVIDDPKLEYVSNNIMGKDPRIRFYNELPMLDEKIDVCLICTSIQYVENYIYILQRLKDYKPKFIVLLRTLFANGESDINVCQNIYGYDTPCKFISYANIMKIFTSEYEQLFSYADGPNLNDMFVEDIPNIFPYECHIILKRKI